jgi:hypothetical protein
LRGSVYVGYGWLGQWFGWRMWMEGRYDAQFEGDKVSIVSTAHVPAAWLCGPSPCLHTVGGGGEWCVAAVMSNPSPPVWSPSTSMCYIKIRRVGPVDATVAMEVEVSVTNPAGGPNIQTLHLSDEDVTSALEVGVCGAVAPWHQRIPHAAKGCPPSRPC